mmetsp:Transcript_19522/g.40748  ORF Transcript_19522/g.40748 Transcript_19522/m.40748 type:complete len:285 (-) Transcript_19522:781-1635(-)
MNCVSERPRPGPDIGCPRFNDFSGVEVLSGGRMGLGAVEGLPPPTLDNASCFLGGDSGDREGVTGPSSSKLIVLSFFTSALFALKLFGENFDTEDLMLFMLRILLIEETGAASLSRPLSRLLSKFPLLSSSPSLLPGLFNAEVETIAFLTFLNVPLREDLMFFFLPSAPGLFIFGSSSLWVVGVEGLGIDAGSISPLTPDCSFPHFDPFFLNTIDSFLPLAVFGFEIISPISSFDDIVEGRNPPGFFLISAFKEKYSPSSIVASPIGCSLSSLSSSIALPPNSF